MKKYLIQILCFSFIAAPTLALENLDELDGVRAARKSTNTFYSGESAGNQYTWQPQTVIYLDTTYNHEVWVLTSTDNKDSKTGHEYGHQPYSADGQRVAILMDKDTSSFSGEYTRDTYAWDHTIMVMRSDGIYLRPMHDAPARLTVRNKYVHWSPIEQDAYFCTGSDFGGQSGFDENAIYKVTVADTSISNSSVVDIIAANTSTIRVLNKRAITSDGLFAVATSASETTTIAIADLVSENLELAEYNMDRNEEDIYWGDTPSGTSSWHDEFVAGNADVGYWLYYMPSGSATWWRTRLWGTDSGAPDHTSDTSDPYLWWTGTDAQKEMQPLNGQTGTFPSFAGNYWSHLCVSPWPSHVAYSDTQGAYVAPAVWDVEDSNRDAYPGSAKTSLYTTWTGWTDWVTGVDNNGQVLVMNRTDGSTHTIISDTHSNSPSDNVRPGQSPDGTKVTYRTDFLNPSTSNGDAFMTVVYYPYPPEITDVSATSGTVTVTFDWRLDQGANARSYSLLGWPHITNDEPAPPREIEKFRLWRCTGTCDENSGTWTPIGTTGHNIFTRYDFSDGTWDAASSWTLQQIGVVNGTEFFYAVTSVEWSGLESRTLSNIFSITLTAGSGTGSESEAYPGESGNDETSPGDLDNISASDFYSSFGSTDLIRYYNIYANDGSAPSIQQIDLIASISKNHCSDGSCSWVDWLGNTAGTTQFVIAAVDTQGNISGSGYVTNQSATHKQSPAIADGQYTITWDDMAGATQTSSGVTIN